MDRLEFLWSIGASLFIIALSAVSGIDVLTNAEDLAGKIIFGLTFLFTFCIGITMLVISVKDYK